MKHWLVFLLLACQGCACLHQVQDFFSKKPAPKGDLDKDGILNMNDRCPETYGLASNNGCPLNDRDGDGLRDDIDLCPDAFGLVANNGCPGIDRDRDGLADDADACPDVPGPSSEQGCPDSDADGDGVSDAFDKCPGTPGASGKAGCPAAAASEIAMLERAVTNLFFENEKAEIQPVSYQYLDRLADLMLKKKGWRLRISGHPADQTEAPQKVELAKTRAEAVRSYFIGRGLRPIQLELEYFDRNLAFINRWVEMEFFWD